MDLNLLKNSERLYGPSNLSSKVWSQWGLQLTAHFHIVPRKTVSGMYWNI